MVETTLAICRHCGEPYNSTPEYSTYCYDCAEALKPLLDVANAAERLIQNAGDYSDYRPDANAVVVAGDYNNLAAKLGLMDCHYGQHDWQPLPPEQTVMSEVPRERCPRCKNTRLMVYPPKPSGQGKVGSAGPPTGASG